MSRKRPVRSREEITRAIARVEREELKEFSAVAGVTARLGGYEIRLSEGTLQRWAREGRVRPDRVRVWLDAIKRGETWYTSEAAVGRFLRELAERQAG